MRLSTVYALCGLRVPALAGIVAVAVLDVTPARAICILLATSGGVMTADPTFTQLSSTLSGGSSASVTATVVGLTPHTIQAIAPANFVSAPAGGSSNVIFSSRLVASGVTVGVALGGASIGLNLGLTNLGVDLTATKSSGLFPAGSYVAEVIVRCL